MRDFEQWIDVVKVDLPEPKGLARLWVQGKEINGRPGRAEQKVVVALIQSMPSLLDHGLTYVIRRRITAVVVGILRLPPYNQSELAGVGELMRALWFMAFHRLLREHH